MSGWMRVVSVARVVLVTLTYLFVAAASLSVSLCLAGLRESVRQTDQVEREN